MTAELSPLAPRAQAPDADPDDLARLRDALLRSIRTSGGTVRDTCDDGFAFSMPVHPATLVFKFHPAQDPAYLRLLMPNFWRLADASEALRAKLLIAELGARCQFARLFVTEPDPAADTVGEPEAPMVSAEIEILLPTRPAGPDAPAIAGGLPIEAMGSVVMLMRWTGALHLAAARFAEAIRQLRAH